MRFRTNPSQWHVAYINNDTERGVYLEGHLVCQDSYERVGTPETYERFMKAIFPDAEIIVESFELSERWGDEGNRDFPQGLEDIHDYLVN